MADTDIEVADLAERLLDHSLPKAEWTHVAHLTATLRLVRTPGRQDLAADLLVARAAVQPRGPAGLGGTGSQTPELIELD